MRIIIRSKDVRLFIPVPLRFGGIAIACIPERTIREMQSALPALCGKDVDKKFLRRAYRECYHALRQFKGLEIVNVTGKDGTYVSVRL